MIRHNVNSLKKNTEFLVQAIYSRRVRANF